MRFQRFGKTYQLKIETAEDLEHILALDEALWVATSAPTSAFRCDPKFTTLVNQGGTGRINSEEVKQAVKWLLSMLQDTSRLGDQTDTLPLAVIHADTPEGKALVQSARYVLRTQGEADPETISLVQVRKFLAELQQQPMNGDGILVPEAAPDEKTAQSIRDAIECQGGSTDASGKPGVTAENLAEFRTAVSDYLAWRQQAELPEGTERSNLMPFGAKTPELHTVYREHADEVDNFFALCHALLFEPRALSRVGCNDADMAELDLTCSDGVNACLSKAPLARPTTDARLPLEEGAINPLYGKWIAQLKAQVIGPAVGGEPEFLEQSDWERIKASFRSYESYLAKKKGACVEKLPAERLAEYRDGPFWDTAQELIENDKRVATVLKGVLAVERLLLYHRYLLRFVNNFVSFSHMYDHRERALFEMGSAVIDGRWFDFAVKTDDPAAHSALAKTSNIFTIYLEVSGPPDAKPYSVAIPATSGTKGNLVVGKRGVFFDIAGNELDARITQIIENPISLLEALVAPFVRLWSFVLGKIEAMSATSEKELQKSADATFQGAPQNATTTTGPAGIAGGPAGILVGLSVSAAAVGSAFAFITKQLSGMSRGQQIAGLAGAALVVLVPVTLVAIMKLRRQDLSSLLEGCGWSINARMRLNRAQRRQFTRRPPYPVGATGTPRHRWLKFLLLVLAVVALLALYTCRSQPPGDRPPADAEVSGTEPGLP